jgi:D-xylulose reductase
MSAGKIDVKPLITNKFAFEDSVEAFDFASAMPPSSVKVQSSYPPSLAKLVCLPFLSL